MADETNISIGKNAPDWLKDLLIIETEKHGDVNVTDFKDEVPDINAARKIQDKISEI